MRPDVYFGCVVYLFDAKAQERLLAECLLPLARELLERGLRGPFSCERHDVRGPHVTALFGIVPDKREDLESRVRGAVESYVARAPCSSVLSEQELRARHEAGRAGAFTVADRAPGIAENNTYDFFEHDARKYPFFLSEGARDEAALWQAYEELVLRALGEIGAGRASGAAARFVAALDGAFVAVNQSPSTWLGALVGGLGRDLETKVRSGEISTGELFALVGAANRRVLEGLFDKTGGESAAVLDPAPLLRQLFAEGGIAPAKQRALLHVFVHSTLQLLGLLGRQRLPLLAFAWARALEREGGGARP